MSSLLAQRRRGTVSLVALCFVAVLGIVLASYLTICSRAMNLSNRSYQAGVAQQLAEFGLEEGLRAFNKNDWSGWASNPTGITGATSAWTRDTTNKRASRTINFIGGKLGQGATATVKIRIDNYDANVVGATYNGSATYSANDLVGSSGIWYRSVRNSNTGQALTGTGSYPNLAAWSPEPIPWSWSGNRSYSAYLDVVCVNGTWYRCTSNHTSGSTFPGAGATWASMPTPVLAIYTNTFYTAGTYAFRIGGSVWLRNKSDHTVSSSWDATEASKWDAADATSPSASLPAISWAYRSGATYYFNDLVYFSGTNGVAGSWYRCKVASTTNTPTNTTDWESSITGIWAWSSSSLKYNLGDVVYSGSQWFRCIQAHTSSTSLAPGSATNYWTIEPPYSPAWDAGRQYSQNDTVYHNGVWYLSLANSNIGQNPATATTYWIGANTTTTSYIWNNTTSYASNAYRCYGGVWYKCLAPHTNKSPNDTTYWTPTWSGAMAVTTGGAVIYAEATITITGSPPIRTQLRAAINPASLLPNALGTTDTLSLGAGGTIDSYDSISDPNPTTPTSGFSAVVASTYSASTAVTAYGTKIQGYVAAPSSASSPYAPLTSFGGNAEVKSTSATPTPTKADPTRISRSPSVPQFATVPDGPGGLAAAWGSTPKSALLPATASTLEIGTPGATTPARYYTSNLTIDGSNIGNLVINGPVVIYVQGNLVMSGGSGNTITITSTGSAEIHVGGSLNINQTSGGIVNTTKSPKKAVIICDSTGSGTYNYSDGDNPFYGVIYAPYFSSTATGFVVDNNNVIIYGAVSAKKIAYTADANLHYDTSLRYAQIPGVDQPYTITNVRALPITEQATMP